MKTAPNFLILSGDGINCENETARAFIQNGAHAKIHHINDLLERPNLFKQFQGLAIPGGFSPPRRGERGDRAEFFSFNSPWRGKQRQPLRFPGVLCAFAVNAGVTAAAWGPGRRGGRRRRR